MDSFVEVIDSMAKASGLKKGEFASRVWPDISPLVATKKWQYMRTKSHITGHPQGVLLSDALRMGEVLDVDLPYVLLKARTLADEKMAAIQAEKAEIEAKPKKAAEKKSKTAGAMPTSNKTQRSRR
jgi:hypothetical protein